ncbi:HAD family hydrolase [Paractinoplanes hotanensis]|uniref:HAD family hydrolase n=1 Tax=Paractinoplanes hotanensis TaxID=2906497 RepID=A0ABT0YAN7_9ACTN|nr:HAD family hydrolase [Actinoplanes hotanensis]MCM4083098.1 HAD family hydrolase [Actinoplanes hotanensis]
MTLGRHVDGVLFDVDDTLVDFSDATARALLAHVGALGAGQTATAAELIACWRALEREHFPRFLRGECSFTEQRRSRARAFCATFGLTLGASDEETDAWVGAYLEHCDAAFRAYDDARPALDDLRRAGYRVGAMSNSNHRYQDAKLRRTGLRDALEVLVCCDDAGGRAKPDPEIFRTACAALGTAPQRTLYVGDHVDNDARAAVRAGLHGVWLARGDDTAAPADVPVIHDLRLLAGLVEGTSR